MTEAIACGTAVEWAASSAESDWYLIAEQPAPAPHLARPDGCAALRIVLVTVRRVSRSCEHFPDGFDLHLLQCRGGGGQVGGGDDGRDKCERIKLNAETSCSISSIVRLW